MGSVINPQIQASIDASVLCWLATVSEDGVPNVSPKEAWIYGGDDRIWVANIASPNTVDNIRQRPGVCLSFVDVFTQKGYKIVGNARILESHDRGFEEAFDCLTALIGSKFEILSIIEIAAERALPIVAPSYILFPDMTEKDMIRQALKSYKVERELE